jgi:hypothetical protein
LIHAQYSWRSLENPWKNLNYINGLLSGTDSGATWARGMYSISAASLVFQTFYRIVCIFSDRKAAPKRVARA